MLVAKELVLLGSVEFIDVADSDGEIKRFKFPKSKSWSLLCNDAGTAIYLLPNARSQTRELSTNPAARKRGKALYRRWSDFEPDGMIAFSVPDSAVELHKIGTAAAIQYRSDKWTGKTISYIHEFTGSPIVYSDRATNPRAFGVLTVNGKTLCTSRGIVG